MLTNTKDMVLTAVVEEFDTLDADEDRGSDPSPKAASWLDSEWWERETYTFLFLGDKTTYFQGILLLVFRMC